MEVVRQRVRLAQLPETFTIVASATVQTTARQPLLIASGPTEMICHRNLFVGFPPAQLEHAIRDLCHENQEMAWVS